jgi:hypothetical protein
MSALTLCFRIQYSALTILLNRHNAGFGNAGRKDWSKSDKSRKACVEHAFIISNLVQDYAAHHGSANTMMGPSLYNISMAATVLVAQIAEKHGRDVAAESASLTICLEAMREMEAAELVARNVRQIVQSTIQYRRADSESHLTSTVKHPASHGGQVSTDGDAAIDSSSDAGSSRDSMLFSFDPPTFDNIFQLCFNEELPNQIPSGEWLQS